MKRVLIMATALILCIVVTGQTVADDDLEVHEFRMSGKTWGNNVASLKLTYSGYNYKFIVASSDVQFTEGPYLPKRIFQRNYMMEPESSIDILMPVPVPASYGKGIIKIGLYDVVDTLDQLLESQKFYEKEVPFEFGAPPRLTDEVNLEIALPVLMEQNDLFSSAIARIIPVLLSRGHSIEDIAYLCNTSTDLVESVIEILKIDKFIIIAGEKTRPSFMVIEKQDIIKILPAIDSTVEQLYQALTANFPAYDSALVEMVKEGELTDDRNNIMGPGVVLYHKYPMLMTFVLWNVLGRSFITDGAPFDIFPGSNPCSGRMGDYFYMVPEGEKYVGNTFYYQTKQRNQETVYCGYGDFEIICEPNFRQKEANNIPVRWIFGRETQETPYIFSSSVLVKPVSILIQGCEIPVANLQEKLNRHFDGYIYKMHGKGARYWCWNLVVTRLIDKMIAEGVIEKEGTGLFSFQKVDK